MKFSFAVSAAKASRSSSRKLRKRKRAVVNFGIYICQLVVAGTKKTCGG
jgi:hypothetical protein